MKVMYESQHPVTDTGIREMTGRSFAEWFALLDAAGGVPQGRKALGDLLYKKEKVDPWWTATLLVEYERSRGELMKDGGLRGYSVCVTKSLPADPARAFDQLRDIPWWLGPAAKASVEEGGAFTDGDGHAGVFRKVAPGKALQFTWSGVGHQKGEMVEIKLSGAAGKTAVVLTHDRLPDRPAADGMRVAWIQVLEQWKVRLA